MRVASARFDSFKGPRCRVSVFAPCRGKMLGCEKMNWKLCRKRSIELNSTSTQYRFQGHLAMTRLSTLNSRRYFAS